MTISREEAMAAIREAEIWTGDGGTIEMGSREAADTLLTLARAGAEVMFASEETVEKIARAIYYIAPPLEWIEHPSGGGGHSGDPIPFDDERSGSYRKTAERHARAALAALSQKE